MNQAAAQVGGEGGDVQGKPSLQECGAICVACVTEVSHHSRFPTTFIVVLVRRYENIVHEGSGKCVS